MTRRRTCWDTLLPSSTRVVSTQCQVGNDGLTTTEVTECSTEACFECSSSVTTTYGEVAFELFEKAQFGRPMKKEGSGEKSKFKDTLDEFRSLEENVATVDDCAKTCAESSFCFKFLFISDKTQCFHFAAHTLVKRSSTFTAGQRTRIVLYPEIGTAGK